MSAFTRLVPAVLMIGTVTAIAQPNPPSPPPADASGSAAGSVTVTGSAKVVLSPAEMTTRWESIRTQIQDDYRQVVVLKERVQKLKDVIKLTCVNDRLVQLKAQMNIADKASQSLQSSDQASAQEAFAQIEASGHSVKELREQAMGCVGEPELYKQEAGIEVIRPELIDDPGVIDPLYPEDTVIVAEPPGYASPFN